MSLSHNLDPLWTRGNQMISAWTGRSIVLRGVNRSGLEYSEPGTAGFLAAAGISRVEIQEIASWGCNIIRLPFNQDWALHGRGAFSAESYLQALDTTIRWASEFGMYTLLDLQWLSADVQWGCLKDGSVNRVAPLPDRSSILLWRTLAERYREEPAVLYDIFNEPHDPLPDDPHPVLDPSGSEIPGRRVSAAVWSEWAETLTGTIREAHPRAAVFVSGTNWGYDLSGITVNAEGVVLSTHIYRGKQPSWERAFGTIAASRPVFAAEWGGEDDDVAWGRNLAEYLRSIGIGWTAWSWRDWPHLLSGGRPTRFGELVKAELAG